MLQNIELIDFKNHVDTKIRLQRLTLLVGPNGAGKTGVLEGIDLAAKRVQMASENPSIPWNVSDLVRRGAQVFQLALLVVGPQAPNERERADPGELTVASPVPNSKDQLGQVLFRRPEDDNESTPSWQRDPASAERLVAAREILGSSLILQLNASTLAAPSFLGSADAELRSDGYGLASTIAHLMTYERERFSILEQSLIELVPSVRSIRVRRIEMKRPTRRSSTTQAGKLLALLDNTQETDDEPVIGDELVLDMRSGKELPATALSEGTLILLGLLTFLTEHEPPRLLLIDDLDRSLHPRAQTQLIDLLRKTLDQHPDLQIVATSHSPYLIDELSDDEVWVLNLRNDGTAAAACLADHPDAERSRGALRTGEFLSSVGEDWVIGPVDSDNGDADAAGTDR
jgi:ABC-type branched-subunit amino acid transport system ATPase component